MRSEQSRAKTFVAEELVRRATPRPRPLLVLLARDVPAGAKKRVVEKLTNDLEGMFVRVDFRPPESKRAPSALSVSQSGAPGSPAKGANPF